MVNINQIKSGLGGYIDTVMLSMMDRKRRFVPGTAYIMMAAKLDKFVPAFAQVPAVKVLGIIDNDGNVDIDSI